MNIRLTHALIVVHHEVRKLDFLGRPPAQAAQYRRSRVTRDNERSWHALIRKIALFLPAIVKFHFHAPSGCAPILSSHIEPRSRGTKHWLQAELFNFLSDQATFLARSFQQHHRFRPTLRARVSSQSTRQDVFSRERLLRAIAIDAPADKLERRDHVSRYSNSSCRIQ